MGPPHVIAFYGGQSLRRRAEGSRPEAREGRPMAVGMEDLGEAGID